ncbi:HD domain-containing protein [Pirellulales bacterium]|nr:HD domain-containing protein [Pirellulales bacterium]
MPVGALRETIDAAPDHLISGRKAIREMHDRGLDGMQVCGRLTSLIDDVVIRVYDGALAALPEPTAEALRACVALVGLGSYGRRQSAPFSDVDLMILHNASSLDLVTELVRPFTQALYDVGLDVGYSVRTVKDAINLARTDPIICTSQIGGRLVAGNQRLYERFRDDFSKLLRKRARSLSRAFHNARAEERHKYGETVYLLEPNVKRSRGALRDLHLLQWLGYVEFGEADLDRLHLMGAMSKFEHRRLVSARTFLLRARNEMHFHAGSPNETLSRGEQLRLAEVYGHRHRAGLLPVEHFMRDYFRHTNHLWQMVRRREASLVAPSAMTRMLDPVLGKSVAGDFRIGLKYVTATPTGLDAMRDSLSRVLQIIVASERSGKLLDQATWSAMLLSAPDCPEHITPEIVEQFLEMLDDPEIAASCLRILFELGYLEKLVPAIRNVRCLLQFNQYHKFTVDEHSLRAVAAAAEFRHRDDALGDAYQSVKHKQLLHLALLLHDLGKGQEEDHAEVGRRIAIETCERLMLNEHETSIVVTLVHRHLAMSHLAFRRDTSDPDEIQNFQELIGSGRRLKMLFVLTCADLAAVGPGVLNDWKIEVLSDLYGRTASLTGGDDGSHDSLPIEIYRQHVSDCLTPDEQADSWYQRQTAALPAGYLAARRVEEVADWLRRCRELPPRAGIAQGRYLAATETVEFDAAVCEGPGRGVFSSMAGALTSAGLKILAANAEVLADSLLLLRFVAASPDPPDQERLDDLSKLLEAAVDPDEPPQFSTIWGQEAAEAAVRLTALPIAVQIDNDATQKGTVIEIFTFDRAGLLYALARQLHDLGLIIRTAKIGTYLDQVVDTFYVVDHEGHKIYDEGRLEEIRNAMLQVAEVSGR